MTEPPRATDDKTMRLRYAGPCRVCGQTLDAGTRAVYERATRSVRCLDHDVESSPVVPAAAAAPVAPGSPAAPAAVMADLSSGEAAALEPVDEGRPGASARREHERRHARREADIRARHPRTAGIRLALSDDPQSTRAWATGAVGEEVLGQRLNDAASDRLRLLHDRRIPRTRGNIDHLAVTPSGVYVIDAKKYKGRPQLKIEGGIVRPRTERLVVGSRDCSKLLDGVLKQVHLVREVVGDLPVHGALCFVEADWPLLGGAFTIREVHVVWRKKLLARLRQDGPLSESDIELTHRLLAAAFPSA